MQTQNRQKSVQTYGLVGVKLNEALGKSLLAGIDVGAKTLEDECVRVLGRVGHLDVDVVVSHQLADGLTLGANDVAVVFAWEWNRLGLGNERKQSRNGSIDISLLTLDADRIGSVGSGLGGVGGGCLRRAKRTLDQEHVIQREGSSKGTGVN
jgi:hypothetical protein